MELFCLVVQCALHLALYLASDDVYAPMSIPSFFFGHEGPDKNECEYAQNADQPLVCMFC